MKKIIKVTIGIFIVLIIVIIALIFFLSRKHATYTEYKGTKDLSAIETSINSEEYYEFEDNGQKYILFKMIEGMYNIKTKIESADITGQQYKNNILYLTIDVKSSKKTIPVPDGVIVDGYSTDSKTFILKVDKDFKGLNVNDEDYELLSDRIIEKKDNIGDNDKYGYINKNGEISIPVEYDGLYEINRKELYDDEKEDYIDVNFSNYLRAVKNDKQGIIAKDGNIIIELEYDQIDVYSKNAFVVTTDDNTKIGIVNTDNEIIKGYVDGGIYNNHFFGKYLVFSKWINGEFIGEGILDRDLNVVLKPIYKDFNPFMFRPYYEDGKWYSGGTKNSNNVINKDYCVVEKDGKTAILDENYKFVTEFSDLSVSDISTKYEKEILKSLQNNNQSQEN